MNLEGEGLTREQLDLISKIMQQTKQTSAQVSFLIHFFNKIKITVEIIANCG